MKHALLIAGISLAAISSAQNTFSYPSNASLRLGWAYPIDDVTRANSRTLIGIGGEWFTGGPPILQGAETTISVDWLGKSSSGTKTNIFPIMLNQRWYNGEMSEMGGGRSYWGFGVGVAVVDVVSTKTVLGLRGTMGMEFSEHLFGEINLFYSDSAAGARATSVGAYIGYRF